MLMPKLGVGRRHLRQNARLVADDEPDVVRRDEVAADLWKVVQRAGGRRASSLHRPRERRTDSTSDTTATAVGEPPAPEPENDVSPPKMPRTVTRFWLPSMRPNARSERHQRRTHGGEHARRLSSAEARAI